MPKSSNQKQKLLMLLKLLHRQSDEAHPIPLPKIQEELDRAGISAERKSLYDDFETLRLQGFDIQNRKRAGYFMGERLFQLAELKLLVDAVQSSKFISEKKSAALISKLEQLTSVYEGARLQRQVYVSGRVKTVNESVYYTIDAIHDAIASGVRVRFRYFDYNVQKEKVFRKGGAVYEVSPWALLWDDENYYLVAYDSATASVRHYRVDKMEGLEVTRKPREGHDVFAHFDLGRYSLSHFGMFGGREERVTLQCEQRYVGVMLDRFGSDAMLIPDGAGGFTLTVPVTVSPQFFGWLAGLGPGLRVAGPISVRQEYQSYLEELLHSSCAP